MPINLRDDASKDELSRISHGGTISGPEREEIDSVQRDPGKTQSGHKKGGSIPAAGRSRIERRRRWLASEKQRIVEESHMPGCSVGEVSRRYGIDPAVLSRWRKMAKDGRFHGVPADASEVPESEIQAMRRKLRDMRRILEKMNEQVEMLTEAVELASGRAVHPTGRNSNSMRNN